MSFYISFELNNNIIFRGFFLQIVLYSRKSIQFVSPIFMNKVVVKICFLS